MLSVTIQFVFRVAICKTLGKFNGKFNEKRDDVKLLVLQHAHILFGCIFEPLYLFSEVCWLFSSLK